MTPRRDCGDEPVGKFDVGTRVTPPRAVTPRVAFRVGAWARSASRCAAVVPFRLRGSRGMPGDRQRAFFRRLYRLS